MSLPTFTGSLIAIGRTKSDPRTRRHRREAIRTRQEAFKTRKTRQEKNETLERRFHLTSNLIKSKCRNETVLMETPAFFRGEKNRLKSFYTLMTSFYYHTRHRTVSQKRDGNTFHTLTLRWSEHAAAIRIFAGRDFATIGWKQPLIAIVIWRKCSERQKRKSGD